MDHGGCRPHELGDLIDAEIDPGRVVVGEADGIFTVLLAEGIAHRRFVAEEGDTARIDLDTRQVTELPLLGLAIEVEHHEIRTVRELLGEHRELVCANRRMGKA